MDRIINKDYIGVVKEENGYLKYYEVDIPQDDAIINEIDEMIDNDELSVLDVQKKFISFYPTNCNIYGRHTDSYPNGYYDYLYPIEYMAAYVNFAGYPELCTEEAYYHNIEDTEKYFRDLFIKDFEKHSDSSNKLDAIEEQIESKVATRMIKYVSEMRHKFNYKRFVYAHNYAKMAESVLKDDSCRMISTDQIGWKDYRFNLNKDVSTFVSTNFGYGSSSYFFCNLSYKGVDILPYSAIVKYRQIGWLDITRYTRQYEVCRNSWKYVFEFVVDAANLAKTNPNLFIDTFIIKEIQIMMKGLRDILKKPKEIYERLQIQRWETPIGYYNLVFNISNSEMEEYAVTPNEKIIAFKMEKITGCLLFLTNLRQIKNILPMVEEYVNEIISMNISLLPEIEVHSKNVTKDIDKLELELKNNNEEIDKIDAVLKQYPEDYQKWHELSEDLKTYKISSSTFNSMLAESVSSEFNILLEKKWSPLIKRKREIQNLIGKRKNFLKQLETFHVLIMRYAYAA